MGAIRDSEVKQLFLNAKPRRLEFGGSKQCFLSASFVWRYDKVCTCKVIGMYVYL